MKPILLAVILGAALPMSVHAEVKVVASFSILGDMVRRVTGDLADVATIVGPDADAHVYTPNVEDAKAVTNADVIFVNGLGFETWSKTLIEKSGTKAQVFVATDGIMPLKIGGRLYSDALSARGESATSYLAMFEHNLGAILTALRRES